MLHTAGWRPPALVEFGSAALLAMISGNGPMAVLGITDPRGWSASAWLSDVIPTWRTASWCRRPFDG